MDSEELKSDKKSKKQKDLVKKACQTDGTPGEEAGYEKTPRPSAWEGRDEKGSVHYLLPLKAERGRLIHQEPTHLGRLMEFLNSVATCSKGCTCRSNFI